MSTQQGRKRRCPAESLEPRRLMAAAPMPLAGTAGANTFYLRVDADLKHLDVWQNAATPGAGTPTQSPLLSAVSTVTITAGGATDAVTLDFANGNPFPSTATVTGSAAATTALTVTGLNGAAVQVNATAVTVGGQAVAYADVQSIAVVGGAGDDTLTQTAQPLAPLTFAGGAGHDTLDVNAGTYTLAGDPAASTANLTVNDAGWLYLTSAPAGTGLNARHLAGLNVTAGGQAMVDAPPAAADRAVVVLGGLTVAATAKLDVTGNDLIVHNGNLTALSTALTQGCGNGASPWSTGAGITSSLAAGDRSRLSAVGLMVNAGAAAGGTVYPAFDGQPAAATDVLLKYTVYGDANLSGTVDVADYTRIDAAFGSTTGTLTGWANGDFNLDGHVDGSDYTLVDNGFNVAPATPATPLVEQLNNALDVAQEQARKTVAAIGTSGNYPRSVNADGTWYWVNQGDWTAGTWPGLLWQLYGATGDAYFKAQATAFTQPLSADATVAGDVGPRVLDAFGPLLAQDPGNAAAVAAITRAAASESSIFSPTVGAFKAWYGGDGKNGANYDVLLDYIMDSPLMFQAAALSGNQTYYDQAVANAVTTETYNVHPDGSTSQFAFFNATTGKFVDNQTYQGYAANSVWSRGQAWAIDGFAQCYAATGRADFLATAERAADWYLAHVPAGGVPYWDFGAPVTSTTPRDTSAAAVAASGLMRLSQQVAAADPANGARYRAAAGQILATLSSPAYLADPAAAGDGTLLHGALNVPTGLTDNAIGYGDYFFAEAVNAYLATA